MALLKCGQDGLTETLSLQHMVRPEPVIGSPPASAAVSTGGSTAEWKFCSYQKPFPFLQAALGLELVIHPFIVHFPGTTLALRAWVGIHHWELTGWPSL